MQINYLFLFTRNILLPIVVFFLFLFLLPLQKTWGAEIEIFSSFNPVGSGARALGMGGAFIAVADDATAASWNPGGLTQLKKPEFSIVLDGLHRRGDIRFGTNPEGNGDHTINEEDLNYISVTYPFEAWGRNMVVSLAYQHLYDFYRELDFRLYEQQDISLSSVYNWKYRQSGSLSALGLSYGLRLIPQLSLGVTLNFWDDNLTRNSWKQEYWLNRSGSYNDVSFSEMLYKTRKYSFEGFNMNIGLLWRINYNWTLGVVLKTPFNADIKQKTVRDHFFKWIETETQSEAYDRNEEMDMPMSYGIGLHYNFSDDFSISADVYRTEWDDFRYKDYRGNDICPITGKFSSESDIDPTCQVRIGSEYRIINKEKESVIPLRCGLFYDPSPAEGKPDDIYGFSFGMGFTRNNRFSLDMAYQYRIGNSTGESMLQNLEFSRDIREHLIYLSMIFYKF